MITWSYLLLLRYIFVPDFIFFFKVFLSTGFHFFYCVFLKAFISGHLYELKIFDQIRILKESPSTERSPKNLYQEPLSNILYSGNRFYEIAYGTKEESPFTFTIMIIWIMCSHRIAITDMLGLKSINEICFYSDFTCWLSNASENVIR